MKRRGAYAKINDLPKLFSFYRASRSLPESYANKVKIVEIVYPVLYGKGGAIPVREAGEYRLDSVIDRLKETSERAVKGTVLEDIAQLNFNSPTSELTENISRLLGDCEDPIVVGAVNYELRNKGHNANLSARLDDSFNPSEF